MFLIPHKSMTKGNPRITITAFAMAVPERYGSDNLNSHSPVRTIGIHPASEPSNFSISSPLPMKEGMPPSFATNLSETNLGVPGRINVNTASHAVLTSLFYGIAVTSDQRATNSRIGANAADDLASVIEKNRPYQKLSDLYPLTTNFVNAQTYTPVLFGNVRNSSPPVADSFDRAREEAFGKFIGHCALQTRVFHLYAVGEALDRHGKTTGRAIVEGLLRLEPDHQGRLIPHFHDVQWH